MKKGKLLIISGFSGVGKGTVVKYILDNYSDYKISISATTRSPREGEVDGTHYHFLTTEKFEDMIKNNHADDNYSNFKEHKKIYSKFDTIFAVSEYVKEVFAEKFGNEFKKKTKIQYNPVEMANNLQKNNGAIPGIRPGRPTTEFITKVISKITLVGALFLGLVATLPILLTAITGMNISLGGTSILIVVGVALDTVRQLESEMMMRHYKGFLE